MELITWLWNFISNSTYETFWTAMATIVTLLGLGFIYWQIRHGVKSADVNLIFSLRDRFWSPEMVQERKTIKTPECITWLKQLREGKISHKDVKVYSPDYIPQFTVFDFFESIGALYRRDKRLLLHIEPLLGSDIIIHYKLQEDFYNLDEVKSLYPEQNFKYLAEICIKKRAKMKLKIPTFEELAESILSS